MSQSTERTAVRTYVPEYQREHWAREADSMDMSLSEFVRSMVQAGRRDFVLDDTDGPETASPAEPRPGRSTPGGEALEDRVRSTLQSAGVASWDELVEILTDDVETRLESALDALLDSGEIELDHRRGGYRLRED